MADIYNSQYDTAKREKEREKRKTMLKQLEEELEKTERDLVERRKASWRSQEELLTHRSKNYDSKPSTVSYQQKQFAKQDLYEYNGEATDKQRESSRNTYSLSGQISEQSPILKPIDNLPGFNEKPISAPLNTYRGVGQAEYPFESRASQTTEDTRFSGNPPQKLLTFGGDYKENIHSMGYLSKKGFHHDNHEDPSKKFLENRIRELEAQVKESQGLYIQLQDTKRELRKVQESESSLQEENRSLIENFDTEKKMLTEQIAKLESKCSEIENKKSEESKLRAEITELQEENSRLKCQLDIMRTHYKHETLVLLEENRKLKSKTKTKSNRKKTLEASHRDLEREFNAPISPLNRHTATIGEYDRMSPIRKTHRRSHRELDSDNKLFSSSRTRKKSSARRETFSPIKKENLLQQIRKLTEENDILAFEKQDLLDQNFDLKRQLKGSRYESARLETLADKGDSKLRQEVEFWKTKCHLLSTKYYAFLRKIRDEKDHIKESMQTQFDALKESTKEQVEAIRKAFNKRMHPLQVPKPENTERRSTNTHRQEKNSSRSRSNRGHKTTRR